MEKIKVLLAEDHTIVRKGIRALLAAEADIEVVGEAENGRVAVERVQELAPDVVVMDITMPELNGIEATCQIRRRFPRVKVLMLSMHSNEDYVVQVLRCGASGYLVKETLPAELVSAIRAVSRGEAFLSPSISRKVIDEYVRHAEITATEEPHEKLTEREREVLQLIAEGRRNRQIARRLHISEKTVETHRANLMSKLDLHATADLTRYAIRRGIISLSG
jgi:DNA-binding NarL/FixJ family response regulator